MTADLEPPPELVDRLVHVKLPVGHGCGFRLRDNLVLTCHHVLPTVPAVRSALARIGTAWGRLEPRESCEALDCTVVVMRGSDARVAAVEGAEPSEGEELTIVEPRPSGGFRITPTRVTRVVGPFVQYPGPTRHGSSGSPVLNRNWQLVALHQRRLVVPGRTDRASFTSQGVSLSAMLRALSTVAEL